MKKDDREKAQKAVDRIKQKQEASRSERETEYMIRKDGIDK